MTNALGSRKGGDFGSFVLVCWNYEASLQSIVLGPVDPLLPCPARPNWQDTFPCASLVCEVSSRTVVFLLLALPPRSPCSVRSRQFACFELVSGQFAKVFQLIQNTTITSCYHLPLQFRFRPLHPRPRSCSRHSHSLRLTIKVGHERTSQPPLRQTTRVMTRWARATRASVGSRIPSPPSSIGAVCALCG